jgi:hypothetical protein
MQRAPAGHRPSTVAVVVPILISILVACGDSGPGLHPDRRVREDQLAADLVPLTDIYAPPPHDRGVDGQTCATGTADNCASCGDTCPPTTPLAAVRVCLAGRCNIQCQGEAYDVNGSVADDCEAKDDLPIHETMSNARDLGLVTDCDGVQQTTATLPSDDRLHLVAPTDRANGRPDWFKLRISDQVFCILEAATTVRLTGLPATAFFRVTATYVCKDGRQLNPDARTGYGGTTLQLNPPVGCTTVGDDSGTLYVKVAKESGPHSASSYTVEIQP